MTRLSTLTLVGCFLLAAQAACHRPQPASPAPVPAAGPDSAAENARRIAAARRDSIARALAARAEAARRDSIARAEAARRSAAAADARAVITRPVYFDFDAETLRPDAVPALDMKAAKLSDFRDIHIRIEGNADDRGSDEYNLALGQRRAAAVKRYLVARGIADSRIDVVSFGEQRPGCTGDEEPCWQMNRRDEFEITSGSVMASQRPE